MAFVFAVGYPIAGCIRCVDPGEGGGAASDRVGGGLVDRRGDEGCQVESLAIVGRVGVVDEAEVACFGPDGGTVGTAIIGGNIASIDMKGCEAKIVAAHKGDCMIADRSKVVVGCAIRERWIVAARVVDVEA